MHMLILTLKLEHFRCFNAVVDESLICRRGCCRKSVYLPTLELPETTKPLIMDAVWGIIYDGVVLIENNHITPWTFLIQLVNSGN